MEKLNLNKDNLKKFGITMGVAFFGITLFILMRHKYSPLPTGLLCVLFFIFAYLNASLLKPIYIVWMRLSFVLGWINTRLILCLIFYLVFTPIGLVIKLLGNDLLARKIEKNNTSYWLNKEIKEFNLLDYQGQF